jgi:hypothetical protein
MLIAVSSPLHGAVLRFHPALLEKSRDGYHFSYPGAKEFAVNSSLSLPLMTFYWEGNIGLNESAFTILYDTLTDWGTVPSHLRQFDNAVTSIDKENRAPESRTGDITKAVFNIERLEFDGKKVTALSLLPLTVGSDGILVMAKEIDIPSLTQEPLKITEVISEFSEGEPLPRSLKNSQAEGVRELPVGIEYLIVTDRRHQAEYERLASFKRSLGVTASVALIDSVMAAYPGVDAAEKLRSYLKEFYQAGGRYLLLGGDQTLIPTRYLVYYNCVVAPTSRYELLPSDLYYADLSGEWDKDGDHIWGEPNQDAPDLYPEILVGRVPLKDSSAVARYIDKLIQYYRKPGKGDCAYLNRHLFFCSDEMRDYPEGGQHGAIAKALPDAIEVDTSWGVEYPSGDDPNPSNPDGFSSLARIDDGYGIINIIAHGRVDGFVVKSANYLGRPVSYILSTPQSGGNGSLLNLAPNGRTSFYYSLSCDVGGYDLDTLYGDSVDYSFVEKLLAAESSGAIGMVANTRWGWVYSSYLLQESFMEKLFAEAQNSPARAMYLSWLEHTYLRDIIYGQNYYGDPALTLYRAAPQDIAIDIYRQGEERFLVSLHSEGTVVGGAAVTLSEQGVILQQGESDHSGNFVITRPLDFEKRYTIAAVKEGFAAAIREYIPSIASDFTGEEDGLLPAEFSLHQNFPNPFNGTTRIPYSLPFRAAVTFMVYNLLGEQVFCQSLAAQTAGEHIIDWTGNDSEGKALPSGIYFYRLSAGQNQATRKMILLK